MSEVGDMGEIPEEQMVRMWYPDGKQPVTAAPVFVPVCEGGWGEFSAADDAIEIPGPASLMMVSATQGASIAYRTDPASGHWKLYTEPLRIDCVQTLTIEAKAVRIGFKESPLSSVQIMTS